MAAKLNRGMSTILLLLILAVVAHGYPQQTASSILASDNQCITGCPRSCSPGCLPTCCSGSGVVPASGNKPEMMITSVEEGETEEVQDGKGFGNPDDSSADPPGTITIPLPPTVYEPPKPGEEPKEMPLPEMKLPASIFEGKLPSESMTLSPDGTKIPSGTQLPLQTFGDTSTTKIPAPSQMDMSPPAHAAPILPPAPPILLPVQTPVLSQPPVPAPPPPPPVISSGGSLPYPKLPPVTVSEIPNRVNRQPPLILPKPKVASTSPLIALPRPPVVPAINLPKPPPIHVNGDPVLFNNAPAVNAPPRPDPLTPVPACGKSCDPPPPPPAVPAPPPAPAFPPAPAAAPVHAPPPAPARAPVSAPAHVAPHAPAASHKYAQPVIEKQQDMRYGVSYGKSRRG